MTNNISLFQLPVVQMLEGDIIEHHSKRSLQVMEQFSDLSFIPLSFVAKDSSRKKRRSLKNPTQLSTDQVGLVDRLIPLCTRLEIDQLIFIIANIPPIGIFQSEQYLACCMKVWRIYLQNTVCV